MSDQVSKHPDPPNETPTPLEEEHLGLAGRMTRAFIDSPLSPLLFIAMLLMGLLGLALTPRQEDPQISVPMIDIFVQYPGASSQQVARMAIDPLQRIMSEIPGVKHVYSAAERSQGIVTVEFDVGQDLGESIVKVHDKIQSNMDKVPPGVPPPLVQPKGIDDVPVVTLTLWSKDVDDGVLRALALDVLQKIKEIPNTGASFIVGGRAEQVRVEVYPERLAGHGISLDQVANTIQTANAERNAGNVEAGDTHFSVVTGAFLRTADEISRLVVGSRGDVPIYVRDVARVFRAPEDARHMVTYFTGPAAEPETEANGEPAITIAVAKKIGTNGVAVANDILAKVETLKGRLIPANVNVAITRNYGETANDKVNELIGKLFKATGFVFLLVLVAFRAFRPAFVVLLVIPVVILITVFSAWVTGYTIDRVSLFALIFSIGILVDDAIVVVENIYRRWLEKGETDTPTAIDAVREVGNPTILATFTVIAALLPMGFVSGMMGPYMEPIPALGSVAMLFSLLAAFAFTPWLAQRLSPSMRYLETAHIREHKGSERLEGLFRRVLNPLIDSRGKRRLFRLVMWGSFALACAMFYTTHVTVKMLPLDNKPEFSVVVDMPEGTALPITGNLTRQLAEIVRNKIPEVTAVQTYAGTARPFDFNGMVRHYYLRQEPWQGELQVQLLHKNERERDSHEIAVQARALLTPIATDMGARISVVEMPPGPPVLQSVVAEVYGPDDWTRRQVAADMTELFQKSESLTDVDNYMREPYAYWRFEVDTEKAVRRGISVDTINRNIAMAMGNYKLGDIKEEVVLEPTNIVIQVPLALRSEPARLLHLPVPTAEGRVVPLAELGRFRRISQDPIIYHKDLRRIEYVVAETAGRLGAPIYGMLDVEDMLKDYVTPDGVIMSGNYIGPPKSDAQSGFEWTGEWTVTYETFRDMGLAFGAALVLIYILVVWEFGNFRIPALIMAPIPLTLLGILPAHALMGAEFTATSMIGWIALAGIIVRNSILLVDFSIHEVRRGTPVREAVILSCKTRTRPILITALALVAGSSVILTDPIFQGMAISLAAGVLVSTLLTLVVIPLGCMESADALVEVAKSYGIEKAIPESAPEPRPAPETPRVSAGARAIAVWGKLVSVLAVVFYIVRAIIIMSIQALKWAVGTVRARFQKPAPAPEPGSPAPGSGPQGGTTDSEPGTAPTRAPTAAPAQAAPGMAADAPLGEDKDALLPEETASPGPKKSPAARKKAARKKPASRKTPASSSSTATAERRTAAKSAQSATSSARKQSGTTGGDTDAPQHEGSSSKKRRGIRIKTALPGLSGEERPPQKD